MLTKFWSRLRFDFENFGVNFERQVRLALSSGITRSRLESSGIVRSRPKSHGVGQILSRPESESFGVIRSQPESVSTGGTSFRNFRMNPTPSETYDSNSVSVGIALTKAGVGSEEFLRLSQKLLRF